MASRPIFERLYDDERAIGELPIQLIALVVGVASLSVMINMISGLSAIGVTELDTQPQPEVTDPGNVTVTVRVVDTEGNGVLNATLVACGGIALLECVTVGQTDATEYIELRLAPLLGATSQPEQSSLR